MSQVVGMPVVGRWAGTVTYGPKVEEFTVDFLDDGAATLITAETKGHGAWSMTGPDTFEFTIKELLNQGDSGRSGDTVVTGIDHLVISISARRSGSSFEGSGKAEVFDAAGTMIFAIAAAASAQQSSAS
jgi:hypothetical protein